jgi:uncharacterized protein with von Willebrand factor type A (vWA) domain
MSPERGEALVRKLALFGRVLRSAGAEVGPGRLQDAVRALEVVDLRSRDEVYWALRCTLVSHEKDLDAFDAAFAAFWERTAPLPDDEATSGLPTPSTRAATPPPIAPRRRRSARSSCRPPTRRAASSGSRSPAAWPGRPPSACASSTSPSTRRPSCGLRAA